MDKVVIITGHSEGSEGYDILNSLIARLFPECEIQIISTGTEGLGNVPRTSESAISKKGENKNEKHSHCR